MKTFFVTGGAGFVGSTLCEKIIADNKNNKLIILDKLTYSGNLKYLKNILDSKRVMFIKGDLLNSKLYSSFLKNVDVAINVAAESHVDNSFSNSIQFTNACESISVILAVINTFSNLVQFLKLSRGIFNRGSSIFTFTILSLFTKAPVPSKFVTLTFVASGQTSLLLQLVYSIAEVVAPV